MNITVQSPAHGDNCTAALELGVYREADDYHYGADADGNRGIFMPGEWVIEEGCDVCPACGHAFTDDENDAIYEAAVAVAEAQQEDEDIEYAVFLADIRKEGL